MVASGFHRYTPFADHSSLDGLYGLPRKCEVVGAATSPSPSVSPSSIVTIYGLTISFTDSPIHDPYSATNGLWYAHCGWIFRKPTYSRMKLIERGDLESDPVVRFQHRYYVQIALFSGLLLPWAIAKWGWGDGIGGLVWGGAVARLLIWHTTFCINSLAHWSGLQPYTEEVTARGNYVSSVHRRSLTSSFWPYSPLAKATTSESPFILGLVRADNTSFHHAFP